MKEKEPEEQLREFLSPSIEFDYKAFEELVRKQPALSRTLHRLRRLCRQTAMPDEEEMWNRLHALLRRRRRRRLWMRSVAAAVIALPLGIGLGYWSMRQPEGAEKMPVAEVSVPRQVQLVLAEGEVIDLPAFDKDTLFRQQGTDIQVDREQGLIYDREQAKEETPVYHLLRVPRGCEYHITLSDATEVWLNSESELRYPVSFVGGERRLQLKGEAYFKVAKDSLRPFRLLADEMLVEVLGTSFNVNAYRDDGALRTTLVEGAVWVKDTLSGYRCLLKPQQQVELRAGKGKVHEVVTDEVVGWKAGHFLFEELPLEQIAKQLERWYDVQIVFREASLREQRFTGIMKRYNRLEDVCAMLEETGRIRFEINGRQLTVCHKR